MTVSEKQLEANKKNAQKGGVKTVEGKAIVKFNALSVSNKCSEQDVKM